MRRYVVDVAPLGKGKRSGAKVDQRLAFLYTIRPEDEKIIGAPLFSDTAEAFAAAESSASQTA